MKRRDLRAWIDKLQGEGLLHTIGVEVDWDQEIGSVTRKITSRDGPALLFENIKDYHTTWGTRFFTNGIGSRERIALALNLPRDTSYKEITRTVKERIRQPLACKRVDAGPVKENIKMGNEVDLRQFPVPHYHHLDGGRYINTWACIVTKNPENNAFNVGIYRGMMADRNKISVLLSSTQHWGKHFAQYRKLGEPMPVACVYGYDPALLMSACIPIQHEQLGYSEYEVAGALCGSPIELVKCETIDLFVPAAAEIVVEGLIHTDPAHFAMEGPFGEYPGYYGGARSPKPTIEVTCITFRNDPIFVGCLEGSSPGRLSESVRWSCTGFSAAAWNVLEMVGVPNVLDVWCPPVAACTLMRVCIDKAYRGHAKQVVNALWGSSVSVYAGKIVTVVDKDIDIHDDEAVDWALAYRFNADMDQLVTFPGTIGSCLDPSVPLSQRDIVRFGQGKWTRVLIDATMNWELEPEEQFGGNIFPPLATSISAEQEELVNRRWSEYGFTE